MWRSSFKLRGNSYIEMKNLITNGVFLGFRIPRKRPFFTLDSSFLDKRHKVACGWRLLPHSSLIDQHAIFPASPVVEILDYQWFSIFHSSFAALNVSITDISEVQQSYFIRT